MRKVIGIDIGGTQIKGGVVNEQGEIIEMLVEETNTNNGKESVLKIIMSMITAFRIKHTIEGVGIGSPGYINASTGEVVFSANIDGWSGVNIKEELADKIELPVNIENDANIAALSESWTGAAKNKSNFIMLTLGTGVGGAVYNKAHGLLSGTNYKGAELGHMILYPAGLKCGCGQLGCAEQYLSGSAIEKKYQDIAIVHKEGKEIFSLASKGDKEAQIVLNQFTDDLATFLVSLKNIFDPEVIVIGGGVIDSKDTWLKDTKIRFKKYCNDIDELELLPAIHGNKAGIIGAASLIFNL